MNKLVTILVVALFTTTPSLALAKNGYKDMKWGDARPVVMATHPEFVEAEYNSSPKLAFLGAYMNQSLSLYSDIVPNPIRAMKGKVTTLQHKDETTSLYFLDGRLFAAQVNMDRHGVIQQLNQKYGKGKMLDIVYMDTDYRIGAWFSDRDRVVVFSQMSDYGFMNISVAYLDAKLYNRLADLTRTERKKEMKAEANLLD